MSASIVVAQSDGGIKQQEDQLIRQYSLPSAPSKAPVYKPIPAPPSKEQSTPRIKQRSSAAPKEESAPAPRQRSTSSPRQQSAPASQPESEPAPQPRRRQFVAPVAPEPDPPAQPAAEEPRRTRRSRPVQESTDSTETDTESTQESSSLTESSDTDSTTGNRPVNKYAVEFNRSPVVGNRFRLRGVYSEARLGFTRPRGWKMKSAKALIRFQHSPALIAARSSLTAQVNGTSIGSIPLNRKESQVGQAAFNIPAKLIQDYNDLAIVVQQNNAECSEPGDPLLWTEVLPDSKLMFEYQPQPVPLNFSRYPFPFFDELSLDANRITYLLPKLNESWLAAAPSFQAALGRLADFRPIDTRLVTALNEVEPNERLVVIGTPADQPALKSLNLPFKISGDQIQDSSKSPLADDVGLLMLSSIPKSNVPVLVVTGNGAEGVKNAAKFLVQPDTSKIGTGQAIVVNKVNPVPTPPTRQWPRYLPETNSFKLSDIKTQANGKPFGDITVRGSAAPPIEVDFRALPDDRFTRGSSMNLIYSYGPQVNPRLSALEVLLDDVFIGGARLDSDQGATRKSLKVDLPANLIKPTSKIKIAFRLNPREPAKCGQITDQQLLGTIHADTSFNLKRETFVQLPNLELLQSGFPFAAPQDLSSTAMVVPDTPSETELLTLLEFSERLGRLSKADSVKLQAYTVTTLTSDTRKNNHLVGIGIREKFPFPKALESGGFKLSEAFSRQSNQGSIQTWQDTEGVIKEVMSPDNSNRVLLALSAQTEEGLDQVRQIISQDSWFFQLQKDTALVSSDQQNSSSYDPDAYQLEFLQSAPSTKRLDDANLLSKVSNFIQEHWFLPPAGIVAIAIILYGISQLYLKRITDKKSH
ncbi:MAG TPA: cellulose synthase [Cyanobacteria bacterium UBA8553]|nr:cellulose synthase [Cyanobacteria bacterium UBA8553]